MFFILDVRAKTSFENLEKNYTKKRSNLRNAKRSGSSRESVEKAENEIRQLKFFTWIDQFIQPRSSRSSFDTDETQSNVPISANLFDDRFNYDEEEEIVNVTEPTEEDTNNSMENSDTDQLEESLEMYPAMISPEAPGSKQNVQGKTKSKEPSSRKKIPLVNDREMDQQKFSFLKNINERMSENKRRKIEDAEDRFVSTVADELRELPKMERFLAKNEIRNVLFRYQMQVIQQTTTTNNDNHNNINLNPQHFHITSNYQRSTEARQATQSSNPIQQPAPRQPQLQQQQLQNQQEYFQIPENQHQSPMQSPSYNPQNFNNGNDMNMNYK